MPVDAQRNKVQQPLPGRKSLFNWKITSLANTEIKFEPRFEIELAKAGEYG